MSAWERGPCLFSFSPEFSPQVQRGVHMDKSHMLRSQHNCRAAVDWAVWKCGDNKPQVSGVDESVWNSCACFSFHVLLKAFVFFEEVYSTRKRGTQSQHVIIFCFCAELETDAGWISNRVGFLAKNYTRLKGIFWIKGTIYVDVSLLDLLD